MNNPLIVPPLRPQHTWFSIDLTNLKVSTNNRSTLHF
jgi:hypothetical protein